MAGGEKHVVLLCRSSLFDLGDGMGSGEPGFWKPCLQQQRREFRSLKTMVLLSRAGLMKGAVLMIQVSDDEHPFRLQ